MSFTRTSLLIACLSVLMAGCSTSPSKDDADFDMPDSVSVELNGDMPDSEKSADTSASNPAKPGVADEDSAAVLARLKNQAAAPAVTARDADHEKQAQQAKGDYERALVEMKKGNLDGALGRFRQLSTQYPALAGPIVNQAIILRKKGQLAASHKLLQDALLTHGRNPYLLNELGVSSRELGQLKKAQASYESAIRIEPNYPKAHYNLAVLADLYLHNPELALQEFQQYQTLIPAPDKQVDGWIKELERRIAKSKQ